MEAEAASNADGARSLSRLEPLRWLAAAGADWCMIALTFLLVDAVDHPAVYVFAVIPLGSRQQALGALFHDAAHHLLSGKRWHNDVLGNLLAAWPLGLTLGGYRRYHFAHHKHLGSTDDPENHHKGLLRQWPLPARPLRALAWFLGDMLGAGLPHLVAAGRLTRPTRVSEAVGLVTFWGAMFGAAWRFDCLWAPMLWIVSIATVFWSGVRLRIWTEHLGTLSTHRIHVPEWVEQLIMPHNIGLHWEHHMHPNVPFYNLGALRNAVAEPAVVSLGSLARAFVTSTPLPSGAVGATVAAPGRAERTVAPKRPWLRAFSHVVLPLAIGLFVYAIFRPRGLLAHDWLSRVGVHVPQLRLPAGRLYPLIACLPSALWTYALTSLVTALWSGESRHGRRTWLAVVLVVALGWELGQAARLWGGTFTSTDLLASVVAFAAAVRYSSSADSGAEP